MSGKEKLTTEELNDIFVGAREKQQKGLLEEAKEDYLKLLDLFSEAPVLHYNLGLIYFEQEQFENAVAEFEHGRRLNPDDVDFLFNLALAKKKAGDIEGAILDYKVLVAKEPQSVDVLYNLGGCYMYRKEHPLAIESYGKVLELEPEHSAANNNIAYLYQLIGDFEKAIFHYRKVLESRPDHEGAAHMLSALTGEEVTSTPDGYVVEVFDNYSDRYEESLVTELLYQVPAKIRKVMDEKQFCRMRYQRGLDLGCGTGLSGQPFCGIVTAMDGVDLSPKMIELARAKNIYEQLVAGNIADFLVETDKMYDFILAADVLAYLGDLREIFEKLVPRAFEGALFCFSTESFEGEGFSLRESGRFAHSPNYVEEIALSQGWAILHRQAAELRKEKGRWVEGELWFMEHRSSPDASS